MSIAAKKMAEVLAWPEQDRALLARQLIASLDNTVETDAETQWNEVIDRRSREMAEGRVDTCPRLSSTPTDTTSLLARSSGGSRAVSRPAATVASASLKSASLGSSFPQRDYL